MPSRYCPSCGFPNVYDVNAPQSCDSCHGPLVVEASAPLFAPRRAVASLPSRFNRPARRDERDYEALPETPNLHRLEVEIDVPESRPTKVGEIWGSEPSQAIKRGKGRPKKSDPVQQKESRPLVTSNLEEFTESIFGTTRIDLNPGAHSDED